MDDQRLHAVLSFLNGAPLNNEQFRKRWASLHISRGNERIKMCSLLLLIQEQLNSGRPISVKILSCLEEIEGLGFLQGEGLASLRAVYCAAAVDVAVRGLGSEAKDVNSYIHILDRCFMVLRLDSSELASVELRRWEKNLKNCLWANPVIGWNQLQLRNLEAKAEDKLREFLDASVRKLRNWFSLKSVDLWWDEDEEAERGPQGVSYALLINQFSNLPGNSFGDWFLRHIQNQDQGSVLSLLSHIFEYLEHLRENCDDLRKLEGKVTVMENKWANAVHVARNTLPLTTIEVSSRLDFQLACAIFNQLPENFGGMRLMAPLGEGRAEEFFKKARDLGVQGITCDPELGQVTDGVFVSSTVLKNSENSYVRDWEHHKQDHYRTRKW